MLLPLCFVTGSYLRFCCVLVEVWSKSLMKDRLLGQLVIQKISLELDSKFHEDWYSLHESVSAEVDPDEKRVAKSHDYKEFRLTTPQTCGQCRQLLWGIKHVGMRCATCNSVCHAKCAARMGQNCGTSGLLRLKYLYTEEYILPPENYDNLITLLTDDNFHVVKALGRVTEEREEVAKTLVTIFEQSQQAVKFLNAIATMEIRSTTDPHTIFRANSLGSKAIDQYMKLIGMKHLHQALQPIIHEIILQNRPCELDPARLKDAGNRKENLAVLEAYIKWCLDRLFSSAKDLPIQLRHVFYWLRKEAVSQFPEDSVVSFTVVTAFIFLRFFNAAIMGPQLFGLCPDGEPPNARNSRTLTLMSKAIQQLANMTPFAEAKEPHMAQLNHVIDDNSGRLKKYIDEICTPVSDAEAAKFNKKKDGGGFRLFGLLGKKKDRNEKEVDIGRQLASVHRHLMRNIEKMASTCLPEELDDVMKLQVILNDMLDIYTKKADEIQEARRVALRNLESGNDDTVSVPSLASIDRLGGTTPNMLSPAALEKASELLRAKSASRVNMPKSPSGIIDQLATTENIVKTSEVEATADATHQSGPAIIITD